MPVWDTELDVYRDVVATAHGLTVEKRKEILANDETTTVVAKTILSTLQCAAYEITATSDEVQ